MEREDFPAVMQRGGGPTDVQFEKKACLGVGPAAKWVGVKLHRKRRRAVAAMNLGDRTGPWQAHDGARGTGPRPGSQGPPPQRTRP